jgi:uncharacterized repeat protein (TIGR02543 family)
LAAALCAALLLFAGCKDLFHPEGPEKGEQRPVIYTVTFNPDGGTTAAQTEVVSSGSSIDAANMPSNPVRSGYTFDGWYTAKNGGRSQFTKARVITGNTRVYAQWTFIPMPDNLSLANALTWLNTNAADGGGSECMVSLSSITGSLFTVGSGVTLTLGNNVTLLGQGISISLVKVNGGTLEMKNGSKISGAIPPPTPMAAGNKREEAPLYAREGG